MDVSVTSTWSTRPTSYLQARNRSYKSISHIGSNLLFQIARVYNSSRTCKRSLCLCTEGNNHHLIHYLTVWIKCNLHVRLSCQRLCFHTNVGNRNFRSSLCRHREMSIYVCCCTCLCTYHKNRRTNNRQSII